MRPIDADALIAEMHNVILEDGEDRRTFYEVIERQPTIEPERKNGKWIDETFKPWGLVHHPYKCNQCGGYSEADSDFCPDCGAKMEGTE